MSNKTRYQGTSGKSRGRSGVEDDPDYSLSASELNSNANSLLKSATRGAGGILTNTYEFRWLVEIDYSVNLIWKFKNNQL